jgi:hypothetical protein
MQNIKTIVVAGLTSLVIVVGTLLVVNPGETIREVTNNLGAVSSPDVQSYMNVNGAFSQGGGVATVSTTSATYTLSFSEMDDESRIVVASTTVGAALTLTLPSSTEFPVFAGYRTWVIENGHTGAATTTTIAAGTGVDLQEPDGQNVVIGINNYAFLTCFREVSTSVVCRVDETIPAD